MPVTVTSRRTPPRGHGESTIRDTVGICLKVSGLAAPRSRWPHKCRYLVETRTSSSNDMDNVRDVVERTPIMVSSLPMRSSRFLHRTMKPSKNSLTGAVSPSDELHKHTG